jgi:hypothetical protein
MSKKKEGNKIIMKDEIAIPTKTSEFWLKLFFLLSLKRIARKVMKVKRYDLKFFGNLIL